MADSLSIGVSGLLAFQRALDTTSHNIANASTPGYSRQHVEFQTRTPAFGYGSTGAGVDVAAVARSYDQLLAMQLRGSTSSFSRLDTYSGLAESVNNLFSDTTTGLGASLQKFVNALQAVASTPTSIPARQVLLSEASSLTERLTSYDTRLKQLDDEIDGRVQSEAESITSIASSIAQLNDRIVASRSASGRQPNDLLDQREQLLKDLSSHISISTVAQDDGAVNVFIGSGQSLVLGGVAGRIATARDPYDTGRINVVFQTPGSSANLGATLTGGSLGGLLDARRELLDPARNKLGQIAAALTSATNAQHREGMDLQGNLGQDFFASGGVQVQAKAGNPGTATLAVTRTNIGALTDHDYVLDYTAGAWALRRADTGAAVALTGTGTAGDPLLADGLSIVVSGTAANGASYLVKPTAGAVAGLKLLITDPAKIAAAAPIRTAAGTSNLGGAQISAGEVLDAANPALRNTTTIQFLTATTYSVNGAGSFAYTSGANIDLNGWRTSISGAPQAGDTFTVSNNTGGVGDNRNVQALSAALTNGILNGGNDTLDAAVGRFVGGIGVATNQAQASRDAQKFIVDDTNASMDSISGVNLDEEAANMLRFQQAYQAAAQIIRVTQTLFDSLLAATGR